MPLSSVVIASPAAPSGLSPPANIAAIALSNPLVSAVNLIVASARLRTPERILFICSAVASPLLACCSAASLRASISAASAIKSSLFAAASCSLPAIELAISPFSSAILASQAFLYAVACGSFVKIPLGNVSPCSVLILDSAYFIAFSTAPDLIFASSSATFLAVETSKVCRYTCISLLAERDSSPKLV